MTKLPNKPTLADYQRLVKYLNQQRGFKETVPEVFMLFLEESGEFAKSARKFSGVKLDKSSKKHELSEEAADVFYLLIDLCNHLKIDLEEAFRQKEKKNQKRKWL